MEKAVSAGTKSQIPNNISLDELCELERAVLRKFSPVHTKKEVFEFSDLEKIVAGSSDSKIKVCEAGVTIIILKDKGVLLEEFNGYKIGVRLSEQGKSLRSSLSSIEDIKRT